MTDIEPIRVLIADDHIIVREGLALLIERIEGLSVVAEARDGAEAVEMFRQQHPDVTLMDLMMPGMDGIAAIKAICQEFPAAKILVLTTYEGDEDIYRGFQAGAKGYFLKNGSREQLIEAIHAVHSGQTYMPAPLASKLADRFQMATLTSRELEVLQLMKEGKTNQQIASALFIVEGTVKSHVNSILAKLGVSDRTQAVTIALRRGLVRL